MKKISTNDIYIDYTQFNSYQTSISNLEDGHIMVFETVEEEKLYKQLKQKIKSQGKHPDKKAVQQLKQMIEKAETVKNAMLVCFEHHLHDNDVFWMLGAFTTLEETQKFVAEQIKNNEIESQFFEVRNEQYELIDESQYDKDQATKTKKEEQKSNENEEQSEKQ